MSNSTYIAGVITPGGTRFIPYDSHSWEMSVGYDAPIQGWLMPAVTARQIMADLGSATGAAREVTLIYGNPTSPVVVSRVIVKGFIAADNDQRLILLMTDVRDYFALAWEVMDANVRRKLGEKRVVGGTLLTNVSVVDAVAFGSWSVDASGKAFTWITFKDAVIAHLGTAKHGRPAVTFVTDDFVAIDVTGGSAKQIQETANDSSGTMALARAIESIPSAGCYVSLSGSVHIFDRTPGAEKAFVDAMTDKKLVGHGSLVYKDNSCLRPQPEAESPWRFYVNRAVELRFDYSGNPAQGQRGSWALQTGDNPYLTPVLRVTDKVLVMNKAAQDTADADTANAAAAASAAVVAAGLGDTAGAASFAAIAAAAAAAAAVSQQAADASKAGQGQWVSQASAFAAWGTVDRGLPTGPLPQITDDLVARLWFGGGLWNYARGGPGAGGGTLAYDDPVWADRINELLSCYRSVFQVNKGLWSKVRHGWSMRVAVWSPENGTKAKATVYCNFGYKLARRDPYNQNPKLSLQVTDSYPSSGLLKDGRPTGFGVEIIDEELGIIAITRNDRAAFPKYAEINVSTTQPDTIADLNAALVARTQTSHQRLTYAYDWSLAAIFTCAPAGPNNLDRCYEVIVPWADCIAATGLKAQFVPTTGYSPDHELRSHLAEARFAWPVDDNEREALALLRMFGVFQTGDDPANPPLVTIAPINYLSELLPLSEAVSAADLMNSLDHYVGTASYPQNTSIVPLGSISSVTHTVKENRSITTVACTPRRKAYNPIDFLPGSARAFLLQEIQQKDRT